MAIVVTVFPLILQTKHVYNETELQTNKQAQATESNTSGEVIIVKAALLVIEFLFALFLTLQKKTSKLAIVNRSRFRSGRFHRKSRNLHTRRVVNAPVGETPSEFSRCLLLGN